MADVNKSAQNPVIAGIQTVAKYTPISMLVSSIRKGEPSPEAVNTGHALATAGGYLAMGLTGVAGQLYAAVQKNK